MASSYLIRLGSINKQRFLIALKHNKRELQENRGAGANIDTTKSHLNYALTDPNASAKCVELHAKVQLAKADIERLRKNVVMSVEIVYSLPINRHAQDTRPFFTACYEWTLKKFAGELLSFDVHLDESAPHAHAILLPLIDGKMQGSKMMGDKGNLKRLNNLFHTDVARHYGLSRNESKRLSAPDKQSLSRLVLTQLKTDPVMKSSIYACIRDSIVKDPLPFAQTLSITPIVSRVAMKSFVDHKRAKGKGSFIT